jgi:hypothetical protein
MTAPPDPTLRDPVRTARLRLRRARAADLGGLHAALSNPAPAPATAETTG